MTSLFTRLILAVDSIKLQNVKIYPKHPPKLCLITAYISLLIRIHEMALIFQCAEENWTWQDQLNGIVAEPGVRTKVSTITCCKSMFVAPFIKASTTLTCVRCSNQDRGKHKSDGHQNVLYARLFLGGGHTKNLWFSCRCSYLPVNTRAKLSLLFSFQRDVSLLGVNSAALRVYRNINSKGIHSTIKVTRFQWRSRAMLLQSTCQICTLTNPRATSAALEPP